MNTSIDMSEKDIEFWLNDKPFLNQKDWQLCGESESKDFYILCGNKYIKYEDFIKIELDSYEKILGKILFIFYTWYSSLPVKPNGGLKIYNN